MTYYAGTRLLAADLNVTNVREFYKTADQLYQSDTTLRNDNELVCSLEANARYFVTAWLQGIGQSASTGDLKIAWSVPSGATGARWTNGAAEGSTTSTTASMTSAIVAHTASVTYGTVATAISIFEQLRIETTNAGTLVCQHAQLTSNANDTGLRQWSHMVVRKVV